MRVAMLSVIIVVALAGCEKDTANSKDTPASPPTVRFGDCAPASMSFESGPRPLPFDASGLDPDVAAADTDVDEDTGTGTAMALDEGKMGRRDSTREAGRYAIKKEAGADNETRKKALEAAAETGVLGRLTDDGAFTTLTGTGDFSSGLDDATVVGEMAPGGGGTGWGTIGTGKYGTMGHGSGTGSGYGTTSGRGGMRGRKAMAPTVRIGNVTATGDLDKNIIRRYVRRMLPRLKHCYEKQLLVNQGLQGTVVANFVIRPDGAVHMSEARGVHGAVASCVAAVIKTIKFPKPKSGGIAHVRYPFSFRPGDGSTSDRPRRTKTPEPAPAPVAAGGTESPAPETPKTPKAVSAVAYEAGEDNPLRGQEAQLVACFAKQTKTGHAAMVVDLTVNDAGAISSAKAHGAPDAKVAACIEALAPAITMASAKGTTARCSLSFGTAPIAEVPHAVDITTTSITYASKALATPQSIVEDQTPEWKVHDLYDALRARRMERDIADRKAPTPVTVTGPMVVRIVDTTPMKVVNRVLKTLHAAEAHSVLASRDGGQWKLLRNIALPVVPVPRGTGGAWGVKGLGRHAEAFPSEPPANVSVLVSTKAIWVGISQANETAKVPRAGDAHDWAAVTKKLGELRAHGAYTEHSALEFGAEDDVTYRDLVAAIGAARNAGFHDWAITDPNALSVRFTE